MKHLARTIFAVAFLLAAANALAVDESLGTKIKKLFEPTPTPTPHRHHAHVKKKASPTPSPSVTPSPAKKKKASPTPTPEETPAHHKKSAEAKPSPAKKKTTHKHSPSPSPTETPTATPEPSASETPSPTPSETPSASPSPTGKGQSNATISATDIAGYDNYPASIRKLVDAALALTKQNLAYTYGSSDPATGGMDCSGFVYYVLRKNGLKDVPRDSSEQYVWIRKAGNFHAVLSRKPETFELDELKPGDLLFWTGTYQIERDPPVTHTMIYLGREKGKDKRIMVGASDGRTYDGKQRFGVSVFDFKLAKPPTSSDAKLSPVFVGYGSVPNLPNE